MERKVIYYKDELNDEFSEAKIVPRKIDGSYVYIHKNPLWNIASYILKALQIPSFQALQTILKEISL